MKQEQDWNWFLRHFPQGDRRADWRAALQSQQILRLHGNKDVTPADLLLAFVPDEPEPADLHLKMEAALNRVRANQLRQQQQAESNG